MTNEPWHDHSPGDPMPCKCGDSVVEVKMHDIGQGIYPARAWDWGKITRFPVAEITDWRFVERKGDDVITTDPYKALEWDKDGIATVILKESGRPEWVRDDDLVRLARGQSFDRVKNWPGRWNMLLAFQIKRRPILTPAEPQLLALLSVATDDEADVILSAARRASIEVLE